MVRLAYEADVPESEVAEPAVDQLGGRARRPAAEVAGVDEGHTEADARGVRGDRGADDPAPDHEQVEPALGRVP